MLTNYGESLRNKLSQQEISPFIGVYDLFSATVAARHYDSLFISGFGFAASYYGLPDIGFISWTDMVSYVQRIRTILPFHHLMVDIDDGYGDPEVACHVVSLLEKAGASGVIMEDQKRPRRCGHFDGKQLMEVDEYVEKLEKVLATRKDLFVVARTDASEPEDIFRRVKAFSAAGADAILVDGLKNVSVVAELKSYVHQPFLFNQIAGGKSPLYSLSELKEAGVSLVIYSTPCLFSAQAAIENTMLFLKDNDGLLEAQENKRVGVKDCTRLLDANLQRRDKKTSIII